MALELVIGSDHGGWELKQLVRERLEKEGYRVTDVGTDGPEPVDYPDFARLVGERVRDGKSPRGIIICGSGVGACVAANKVRGVRAGLCHDSFSAHQGVEDDDMNVLCLGARIVGPELAWELVRTFLKAAFSGEERHRRRLDKVLEMERAWAADNRCPSDG